jgi:pilus assembly protein CpaC
MPKNTRAILLGLVVAMSQAVTPSTYAQAGAPRAAAAVYTVPLYKSTIVPLNRGAKRVSVGNPGIADILVIRERELYVVGKALGSTNVVVWDDSGTVFASFDVEVTHDLEALKSKLFQLLPGEDVKVYSAQERLIVGGQVSSPARMQAALDISSGFLPKCIRAESDAPTTMVAGSRSMGGGGGEGCKGGLVVNLMQVGGANEVMIKVTVAEMARTLVQTLNSQLNLYRIGIGNGRVSGGGVSGGGSFPNAIDPVTGAVSPNLSPAGGPVGPPLQVFQPNNPAIAATGLFMSYLSSNLFVQEVLDVSKRNGQAKILAEPTLTTLTGESAQFLSGGEFPIPVPAGGISNAVTVTFKEFGVGVKFVPVVLDSGRINMKVDITVSELASDNSIVLPGVGGSTSTFVIPSLTKRSTSNTVELGDGQTIGIAGLINDNMREFVQKFPGLGDIPLLGLLFRSQQYQAGQSELVIFVTPHLAKPISPAEMRLPTDTFVPPGDLAFYLLGSMGSEKDRPATPVMPSASPQDLPKGSFGHDLTPNNP